MHAPLKNLPSAKEEDLRKLHAAIVPDQSLADFTHSFLELGQMTELNNSEPKLLLKVIIGDKSTKSLHVALALELLQQNHNRRRCRKADLDIQQDQNLWEKQHFTRNTVA